MSDIVADLRAHAQTYADKAAAIASRRDLLPPVEQLAVAKKDLARQIADLQAQLDDLTARRDEIQQQSVDRAQLDYQHRGYVEVESELRAKADGHEEAVRRLTAPPPPADALRNTGMPPAHLEPAPDAAIPAAAAEPDPTQTITDPPPGRPPFPGPDQGGVGAPQGDGPAHQATPDAVRALTDLDTRDGQR